MLRRTPSLAVLIVVAATLACAQDPAPGSASGLPSETKSTAAVTEAAPDARAIMQRAVAKDIVSWQAAKDYTFLQRTQEDALDGNGRVKSSKSETCPGTLAGVTSIGG